MRITVNKTYKMLIGGAFVRSESNRTLEFVGSKGKFVANYSRATRKDVRDAVKAARAAAPGWQAKSAYNRGQILYRLAEMLEARRQEFLNLPGGDDVDMATDCLLYYAGWADKYQQIIGTVNPVATPFFNFSMPEPMGVVAVLASGGLYQTISSLAPLICGGNVCVLMAPDEFPLVVCEFGEIVATSDVPSGVINLLTGRRAETLPTLVSHMEVNALSMRCASQEDRETVRKLNENLKRVRYYDGEQRLPLSSIEDFQEIKTVWHPVGY